MRKTIALLLALILLFSLGCTAFAEGTDSGESNLQIIRCPEQEFSTLCSADYTWNFNSRDGITIYTEYENSIPYVLIFRSEDWLAEPADYLREQYTPHMQQQYGSDLVSYEEYDSVTIGGRSMAAAFYTYRLQGYLIDMVRAMDTQNGHTVVYTAKYIQGEGDATLDVLDTVAQYYRPWEDFYSSDFYAPWYYVTTQTSSGDTIFIFDEVFVTIPASWAGKYDIKINESSISFYHSLSRRMWNSREGYEGGLLFSLCRYDTEDYKDYLPSFDDLGAGESGWYALVYPTDYQAYQSIPTIRAEYDEMWADIDVVSDGAVCYSFMRS